MDFLILIRHGDSEEGDLTEVGKKQMVTLANRLVPFVRGKTLLVISSPLKRACQSAEIIIKRFDTACQANDALMSFDDKGDVKLGELYELFNCQKGQVDAAIWITHLEHIDAIPGYLAEKELGINDEHYRVIYENGSESIVDFFRPIDNGTAWIIDFKENVFYCLESREL